ncbi:endonuclease/exonuclease/phosphatase family protein [Streptomyces triculaminicus]|uniref:endonuclease/exonuclease/phosphatase family protein n=1 Tax=Streptomyces triculaminicus TaxID=2816232 RepID=UPI0033E99323
MAWRAFRCRLSAVTALLPLAAAGLTGTARAGQQAVPCPITIAASDASRSALGTVRVVTPLRVETWNMQGSTAQGECLWALQVRPLARTNHVVALQEAGAPPASAANSLTNRWVRHGFTVEEYLWETGTRRRPETYYLYWMRTDTSSGPAGRVNLALVVPEAHRAVDVAVAWDPAPNRGSVRPALGIVPSGVDTWVFTVHASAQPQTGGGGRGGWDGPRIVQAVECAVAGSGRPWIAAGDWNRVPNNWAAPTGARMIEIAPQQPTRPASGSVIDYAVVNDTLARAPRAARARTDTRRGGGQSDHLPVAFEFS